MELFLSTYVNKVDRKGRVSVPATFRSTLATNSQPNLIVAFPLLHVAAVECTGSNRIEEMQERIDTLEQYSEEHENLTQLFADSYQMQMDLRAASSCRHCLRSTPGSTAMSRLSGAGRCFICGTPFATRSTAPRSANARASRARHYRRAAGPLAG